jgi:hypothetical protein
MMDEVTARLLQDCGGTDRVVYKFPAATTSTRCPHQGLPPPQEMYSVFSDAWTLLLRDEWYRFRIDIDTSCGEVEFTDAPTMYHGTEWGSAIQILRSGMFITGPGTHSIRGSSRSGCWCVPTLPDALLRSNPFRYKLDGNYNRFCTPVVLELRAVNLVKVPGSRSTMHCSTSSIGSKHTGLLLTNLHCNVRLMSNFVELELPSIQQKLLMSPTMCRVCSCGLCGAYSDPLSPEFQSWRKSGRGLYYHPRCYGRVTGCSMVF